MGKLIVIEGVDGSGKQTQSELLFEYLKNQNKKVMKISFPDYDSPSSELVKMYLNGDFGLKASDTNPYAASSFFAADRFASFKMKWEEKYNDDYIIIADRYVASNMIHQASKIEAVSEKNEYLDWIYDFEYIKLKLPKPDLQFFLDIPPAISEELIKNRLNKFSKEDKKDIHESDFEYIEKSYNNALFIAKKFDFKIINCIDNTLRSIDDIQKEIRNIVDLSTDFGASG